MRNRTTLLLGCLFVSGAFLPWNVHAQGDIYRCKSADGGPLFTNIPNDPRCTIVLKGKEDEPSPVAQLLRDQSARRIRPVDRTRYDAHIQAAAREHDVEPELIHAVISAESAYNPLARSAKGARGLMQLIPETGARFGAKNLLDPKQNIDAGTRYLKELLTLFQDTGLALAAYNAGEGAVLKYGRIPPYAETMSYVPKVLAYYRRYRGASAATAARARPTTG